MTKEELVNLFGKDINNIQLALMVAAYNLALDHAAENADTIGGPNEKGMLCIAVNKETITNLKITE